MYKKRLEGDYVEDIYNSILAIEKYIKDYSFQEFEKDDKTYNAVIRMLEVIGEAAGKISEALKNKYPEVEWAKIKGMRNRIAHEYFGVDLNIIWDITREDLSSLKESALKMLEELENEE